MKKFSIFAIIWISTVGLLILAADQKYQEVRMPKPLKLSIDLRSANDYVEIVLKKMGYKLQPKETSEGNVLTKEEVEVSGVYAMSELKKIAIVASDYTTSYHKGKYYIEITLHFLKPKLTSVAALAHITGLKRSLDGKEEWVPLKSNGILEMRFLNELSIAVTGKRAYDKKKLPYWKKQSQEIELNKK